MKAKLELVLTSATINPEKAGGDDGEKGSALRFDGDVLVEKLAGLFTSKETFDALVKLLYNGEDGHDLIAHDLGPITMTLDLEKVKATIKGAVADDERLALTGCKMNSVVLTPKHGRAVGVTLKLYAHPKDEQWNVVAATVRKTVMLHLSGGKEVEEQDNQQPSLLGPQPTVATQTH